MLDAYIDHIMAFIDPAIIKPFKVVADAGNGMGGLVAPKMFARLPCHVIEMCYTPDGSFPNHEANPLIEENRAHIVERVVAEQADIGIAWDGDADRCFFIDGTGEFISGDFVTALLAEAFLLKHPSATVVYDLRASYAVRDTVLRYGGRPLMNRVGHAFIKRRMRDEDAIFGGEVTGHYYFRDNFYADNGFIPALLMLELMSKKNAFARRAAHAAPGEVLHLGRDQHEGRQHGGARRQAACPRAPVQRRRRHEARWRVGGIRGLALQRARVEHRAAHPVEPGSHHAGADGEEAGRGPGGDQRVEPPLTVDRDMSVAATASIRAAKR